MSIQLPIVDLSSATINVGISVDWQQQIQPQAKPHGSINSTQAMPHLSAFNESGIGLSVIFPKAGDTDFIPAGQWKTWTLDPAETSAIFTPTYILPGAQVTSLILVYYYPNEIVPTPGVLGNSPVNIGGNVNVSSASSIKNDGNLPNTSIIESTPSDQSASSFNLGNDGSGIWKILSAGNLRSLINAVRGDNGANKAVVTIGDTGDLTITTFYGTLGSTVNLPAAQITGTLPASQVGTGYPAADITGTLPASQVGAGYSPANLGSGTLNSGVTVPGGQVSGTVNQATNANNWGPSGGIDIANYDSANYFGTNNDAWVMQPQGVAAGHGLGWLFQVILGGSGRNFTLFPTGANGGAVGVFANNGGGANGTTLWVGTTDPGSNAVEGDIWIPL